MTGVSTPTPKRAAWGRVRDPVAHERILAAVISLLATTTYQALTIEKVAKAAGTGKATIYRWWKSKGELVGEALAWCFKPQEAPHTDSVADDLRRTIDQTVRNYSDNLAGVVVPALAADIAHDPDLRASFIRSFLEPRRAAARQPLERAISEGLLPEDLDVDLVMDMWAGAIFYRRLMSDEPLRSDFAERFADMLLNGQLPLRSTE